MTDTASPSQTCREQRPIRCLLSSTLCNRSSVERIVDCCQSAIRLRAGSDRSDHFRSIPAAPRRPEALSAVSLPAPLATVTRFLLHEHSTTCRAADSNKGPWEPLMPTQWLTVQAHLYRLATKRAHHPSGVRRQHRPAEHGRSRNWRRSRGIAPPFRGSVRVLGRAV